MDPVLQQQRLALARPDALVQMGFLGLATGLLSGLVIVLFRWLMERMQQNILPGGMVENYEELPAMTIPLLLLASAVCIWILFRLLRTDSRQTGVAHVIEVLHQPDSRLPVPHWLGQFFGGIAAIVGGFSVGREGPGIHLGAAGGSFLGSYLRLPNNSQRTLIACGAAASIAASFNTPLAGVIFTMEVIVMEYSIIGFAPIILAAVSATVVSRAVYGDSPAFTVLPTHLASLPDLFSLALLGVIAGLLASLFIQALEFFANLGRARGPGYRFLLAIGITLPCAWIAPEIMGVGYDTAQQALQGSLGMQALLLILGVKLLATAAAVGLGIPGGLIGPTLILGAATGALLAGISSSLLPGMIDSSPALYVTIGMIAFMGSTLHAPLAALITLLEMTYNPDIILPGMLAVIMANVVSRVVCKKEPVFLRLLKVRGVSVHSNPVSQWLQRAGVESVMDPSVLAVSLTPEDKELQAILAGKSRWILAYQEKLPAALFDGDRLRNCLVEKQNANTPNRPEHPCPALTELGLEPVPVARCYPQATLWEAREIMNRTTSDALYIQSPYDPEKSGLRGILTRKIIDSHY